MEVGESVSKKPGPPPPVIHALLEAEEIDFSGNHVVEKDTTGNFSSPEWRRGRGYVHQSPVCYTRNKNVQLTAKFSVTRAPSASESVQIRGRARFGSATLEWTHTATVGPTDTSITTPALTSNAPLPNTVACHDPVNIRWEINPAGTGWTSAGNSAHLFYVVLADPSGTPPYWTLLDISCRAAHGETTQAGVVTKTFIPFTTRSLTRKRDGKGLTYWKPGVARSARNTSELLSFGDGSGECGSWSEFLIDMYKVHGIVGGVKILVCRSVPDLHLLDVDPSRAVGFLVKNWRFVGSGSLRVPFTHRMGTECIEMPGIPGQRNANPPPAFYNHFIVRYGSNFYDPSYGVGPTSSQSNWENGAIDGLFRGGAAGFQKALHLSTNLLEFF